MTTKIKLYLGLTLFLIGIISYGCAFAQQPLPAGGSSFETAVQLGTGKYQGGPLQEWQPPFYYSIQVKAGQKVSVEAKSFSESGCSMYLYNEAQEELVSDYDTNPKINWLANANKSSYNYYLKIANDASSVESFTLEVSLTNYYDANSGTDAGDTFDKAVNIVVGNYSGYLSGNAGIADRLGDDWKDMYKIGLKKGETYEFKITPPSKTELTLGLYDSNRQLLEEKDSANKGGIVSLFLTPSADTNVFVSVFNYGYPYQDAPVDYKLDIKSSAPVIKFYACDGQYCGSVGEFSSKEDCQKATTKTCYQTENCDGKCGTTITPTPTLTLTPTPTSPPCENECKTGQTKCFDNFNYH
ncbi:MAG: hypothetical protein Q8L57_04140, partial [bacterium]|nr:hypothetical protein [bacterium]